MSDKVFYCDVCSAAFGTNHAHIPHAPKVDAEGEIRLIEKLREKLKPVEYDTDATENYAGQFHKCEPPCDSYGVCSECIDIANIHVGAEYQFKRDLDAYQKREEMLMKVIEGLIEKLSNTRECMLILIDKPNGIKETLRADFIQHNQELIDLINSEETTSGE